MQPASIGQDRSRGGRLLTGLALMLARALSGPLAAEAVAAAGEAEAEVRDEERSRQWVDLALLGGGSRQAGDEGLGGGGGDMLLLLLLLPRLPASRSLAQTDKTKGKQLTKVNKV